MDELSFKILYSVGFIVGEHYETLLCKLEDGIVYNYGISMVMFHRDPLLRRVTEIIDRVVQAGLYNYWISALLHRCKLYYREIILVRPLDEYYSFNLYHMQSA